MAWQAIRSASDRGICLPDAATILPSLSNTFIMSLRRFVLAGMASSVMRHKVCVRKGASSSLARKPTVKMALSLVIRASIPVKDMKSAAHDSYAFAPHAVVMFRGKAILS